MDTSFWMHNLGAIVTTGLGVMALVRPAAAAGFTSMQPVGALGVSEIRATYGGLFAAIGLACLLTQSPHSFTMVGVAWLGAALGSVLALALDRSDAGRVVAAIVFEAAVAALLLVA